MATYLTGRTRTLTFNGTTNGVFAMVYANSSPIGPNPPFGSSAIPFFSVQTILGYWSLTFVQVDFMGPWNCNVQCSALGISPVTTTTVHDVPFGSPPYSVIATATGGWSISAPVEEVFEIDYDTYPSGNLGTQLIDPPLPSTVRVYEQLVVGGYVTVSVDAGECGSGTATKLITTANQIPIISGASVYQGYQIELGVTCSSSLGYDAFAVLTASLNKLPYNLPTSYSGFDTWHTWSAGNGLSVTCNSASSGDGPTETSTNLSEYMSPPRTFTQGGQINALNSPYPADIKVLLYQYASSPGLLVDAPSGGSYSSSYTQNIYEVSLTKDGGTPTVLGSYDDASSVSGIIQAASLTANNEDYTLNRLLCRGFLWNAMTMTQAETMNVDNAPQITNWTAGTNTTLADSGDDEITATISGGLGSLSSSLPIADTALTDSQWVGVSFCGYRFLRMMLTGDDDDTQQPASVVIGTKEWDFTVGTSGYVDIDLCCPTNRTSSTDTKDSQWEWNGPAPYSENDTVAWGVSNVSTLTIKNLANGHTYYLSGIHLVRNDHTGMTFLPTYKGWLQAFPSVVIGSVTSTTCYRRARQADTDGRQSREDTDAVWIHTVDGEGIVTDTYSEVAISAVVAGLHTGGVPPRDGWDATDLMPNPGTCTGTGSDPLYNCFLNSDRSSCYLFGSGAIYDGKRWTFGFDIGCTSSATIPAQILFDSITDWYPDCGDVWGWQGGGYGPLQIQSAAILRGAAYGLINNSAGDGVPDVLVDVKDAATGLIDVGSGYSSSIGEYKTGKPYGCGLVSYKVTAESGSIPYPNLTGTFISRHRSRFCFPGVHVPICCDIIFCPDDFLFPFMPFAGDHTILPLDDYESIPDGEEVGVGR